MEVGEKLKNLDQMKTVSEEQLFVELTELSLGEILSEPFWQAAFQKLFRLVGCLASGNSENWIHLFERRITAEELVYELK